MITWGVGSIPFNVHIEVERDEDPVVVIRTTQVEYVKAFKGT
jgi:hypothetical protein